MRHSLLYASFFLDNESIQPLGVSKDVSFAASPPLFVFYRRLSIKVA